MVAVTLWGFIAIIAGGFFAVYGVTLFRVALLGIGFLLGYSITMSLTSGIDQDIVRLFLAVIAGGIVGGLFYGLFNLAIYVAGAVLGFVVAMLALSLFAVNSDALSLVAIVAGFGIGGFFGRFLGDFVVVLATSIVGSYAIVYGLALLFPEQIGQVGSNIGQIPVSTFTLFLLAVLAVISGLSQYQIMRFRRPLRR
jgi:hypothetical protein